MAIWGYVTVIATGTCGWMARLGGALRFFFLLVNLLEVVEVVEKNRFFNWRLTIVSALLSFQLKGAFKYIASR